MARPYFGIGVDDAGEVGVEKPLPDRFCGRPGVWPSTSGRWDRRVGGEVSPFPVGRTLFRVTPSAELGKRDQNSRMNNL